MRISDWSSDVCSSDLKRLLVANCHVYSAERTHQHAAATVRGLGKRVDEDFHRAPLTQQHLRKVAQDRRIDRSRIARRCRQVDATAHGSDVDRSAERGGGKEGAGTGMARWAQGT